MNIIYSSILIPCVRIPGILFFLHSTTADSMLLFYWLQKKLFVPYTYYQKFWEKNALSTLYLRKLSTKFLNLKKSSKVKTVIWAMY